MKDENIYRCTISCPIHKHCFVLKTENILKESVTVFQKCPAENTDIRIKIGGQSE